MTIKMDCVEVYERDVQKASKGRVLKVSKCEVGSNRLLTNTRLPCRYSTPDKPTPCLPVRSGHDFGWRDKLPLYSVALVPEPVPRPESRLLCTPYAYGLPPTAYRYVIFNLKPPICAQHTSESPNFFIT